MDKFTSQIQVEEDPAYQAWLDAQEVADIRAMEAEEELAAVRRFVCHIEPAWHKVRY